MKLGDFEVTLKTRRLSASVVKESFTVTRAGALVASGIVKGGCVLYLSNRLPGPSHAALALCLKDGGAKVTEGLPESGTDRAMRLTKPVSDEAKRLIAETQKRRDPRVEETKAELLKRHADETRPVKTRKRKRAKS